MRVCMFVHPFPISLTVCLQHTSMYVILSSCQFFFFSPFSFSFSSSLLSRALLDLCPGQPVHVIINSLVLTSVANVILSSMHKFKGAVSFHQFKGAVECLTDCASSPPLPISCRLTLSVLPDLEKLSCKCVGMTGSCASHACWLTQPLWTSVGAEMKNRYWAAQRFIVQRRCLHSLQKKHRWQLRLVRHSDKGTAESPQLLGQPSAKALVFSQNPPNYCHPNKALGFPGVHGRYCTVEKGFPNSCDHLCCNEGYVEKKVFVAKHCDCKIVFCCKLKCKVCRVSQTMHVCK